MTQVRCYAKDCEHNEYGICQLSCIELEESDLLWKDCGQSKDRKTEPTISKMEQVDKDINVRSKDEPTTQTETQNSNLTFEKDECAKEYEELGLKELKELIEADRKTEPSNSDIPNNCDEPQLTPNYCGTCKHREVPCGDLPCDVCHGYSNYEPKDEPTISKMEQVEDEPQTERSE